MNLAEVSDTDGRSNRDRAFVAARWIGRAVDGSLRLIDQTRLPREFVEIDCRDVASVWEAIRSLRVRGAPAIGVAAAYGAVIGAREGIDGGVSEVLRSLADSARRLGESRPTAVNLFRALDRMTAFAERLDRDLEVNAFLDALLAEAREIETEDAEMCRRIGEAGATLIESGWGVLTHCNAGALATSAHGTALAVIYAAQRQGKAPRVFADETRPLLQGARLTAWELDREGVDVTLICDNMAAQVMREGKIRIVVVGADRIASNGDTANKIGTYGLAVLAKAHGIPFYVAAPSTTFDPTLSDGSLIPIEQRDPREITEGFGPRIAPERISVYNPAFDVTPAELISGIITDRGVISPVNRDRIREVI